MLLNKTVGKFLCKADLKGSDVGVEIEMEASSLFPDRDKTSYYWRREHDGSLRGDHNIEYVLKKPMKKNTAFRAIDKLIEALRAKGTRVDDSVRAGTHVHINVRDLTFREMWTMVTCWYVVEELLTSTVCGKGRIGNHFCLCADEADAVLFRVVKCIQDDNYRPLRNDDVRYSALNFVALFLYGSLEFRAMRTPVNLDNIKLWIDILTSIKENSHLFQNPRRVVENFSLGGEEPFLRALLGNEKARIVMKMDPRWEKKLKRGIRVAQEIAYAIDDWDAHEVEVPNWVKKLEEPVDNINELARKLGVDIDYRAPRLKVKAQRGPVFNLDDDGDNEPDDEEEEDE